MARCCAEWPGRLGSTDVRRTAYAFSAAGRAQHFRAARRRANISLT